MMIARVVSSRTLISPSRPVVAVLGGSHWSNNRTTRFKSTAAALDDHQHPTLKHVPSLPVIGSLLKPYSRVPHQLEPAYAMKTWPELTRQYGDFYTIGIPGIGEGSHGTVHVLQDPFEMMKVLRSEGKFPSSVVTEQWPVQKYFKSKSTSLGRAIGILEMGEPWKLVRNFLQKDLLAPASAKRYIPNIGKACKYISKGISHRGNDLNLFLNEASMDMFATVLLGQFIHLTDPHVESDPDHLAFCRAIARGLQLNGEITRSIYESIVGKILKIETSKYKQLGKDWDTSFVVAQKMFAELHEKKQAGTLNEYEQASYWNQAHIRRLEENSELTEEEVDGICFAMLSASVDTTAGKTAWHLLHVGLHPEVQERANDEARRILEHGGGEFKEGSFTNEHAPYLNAILRESHRLTNPSNLVPIRTIADNLEVHGINFPSGTVFAFDAISKNNDPTLLENPREFKPERWLPDAVTTRKGTRAEILDHPLFSGPFGQGARRCPGSRVARNEGLVLLAQLSLDWKIHVPGVKHWSDVPYGQQTVIAPYLPRMEFEARN
jgi:cytochrome P450